LETTSFGRADLHMHTNASDGLPTVRELLNHVAQNTKLDVIAITDHDRVDAALWAYERRDEYPFEIIPGSEVSSAAGHILGVWVKESIPQNLSLSETAAAIHEQDGIAILAHPYHIHLGVVARNVLSYTRHPEMLLESGLDAVEVYNAGIVIPGMNILARQLARRAGIVATGGSDAHTLGGVGCGLTRFPGKSAADLRTALAEGTTAAEGRAWPLIDYWNYFRNSTHNTSSEFLAENLS
jgi:predicted metal-dependent phosphoesterase TrpH